MTDDIIFWKRDANVVETSTIEPLVITTTIGLAIVRKVLVECGSSVNILFKKAYDQMMLEENDLKPCKSRIQRFKGTTAEPIGYVELLMVLGEGDRK